MLALWGLFHVLSHSLFFINMHICSVGSGNIGGENAEGKVHPVADGEHLSSLSVSISAEGIILVSPFALEVFHDGTNA